MIEKDWITKSGLRAVVMTHDRMGHRCGYVGIAKDSPLAGKNYDNVDVDVHGGLTFGKANPKYPVESDLFWFGYDCAHAGDLVPGLGYSDSEDEERTLEYCIDECESLAKQLMEKASSNA